MSEPRRPELDCGDNSCIFAINKGGMRTNGGCRCFENAGFHRSSIKSAMDILPEILALRAENAELRCSLILRQSQLNSHVAERDQLQAENSELKAALKGERPSELLNKAVRAEIERDAAQSALATAKSALERVTRLAGRTQLAECCVHKTCTPHWDDGKKLGHCTFQFGVSRGFGESAATAEEALRDIAAMGGEG